MSEGLNQYVVYRLNEYSALRIPSIRKRIPV